MDEIRIDGLNIYGIHGATEKERYKEQRFEVSLKLKVRRFTAIDSMHNTVDYRIVKRIAIDIIKNQKFFLLETIAQKIAEEILYNTSASSVTVKISKPEIWDDGIPSVKISREKIPPHLDLLDFDIENILEDIAAQRGISFPIIPEKRRIKLVGEANSYEYQSQPEIVGRGQVREQLSSFKEFPENSLFHKLRDDFMELIIRKLASLKIKNLFATPIEFNDMSLQKYPQNSIGITPHKDGASKINLICIFNLIGKAEFAVCDDRSGSGAKFLDTTPGNVIIIKAPGFFSSTHQPFHFVRNITEERIVFGLRQTIKPK